MTMIYKCLKNNPSVPFCLAFAVFMSSTVLADNSKHTFMPEQGYVPDAKTAIKIAEAIWLPIYGERIYEKKPFVAKLQGEIWVIQGSLSSQMLGGVPTAEISKKTGEILKVSHGK